MKQTERPPKGGKPFKRYAAPPILTMDDLKRGPLVEEALFNGRRSPEGLYYFSADFTSTLPDGLARWLWDDVARTYPFKTREAANAAALRQLLRMGLHIMETERLPGIVSHMSTLSNSLKEFVEGIKTVKRILHPRRKKA